MDKNTIMSYISNLGVYAKNIHSQISKDITNTKYKKEVLGALAIFVILCLLFIINN